MRGYIKAKAKIKYQTLIKTFWYCDTLGRIPLSQMNDAGKEGSTLLTRVPDDLDTQDAFLGPVVTNVVQAGDGGTGEGQVNVHKQEKGG